MCAPAEILKMTLSQLRVDFYFFAWADGEIFDGADNRGYSDPVSLQQDTCEQDQKPSAARRTVGERPLLLRTLL